MKIKVLLNEPNRQLIKELHEGLAAEGYGDVRQAHSQVFQYLSPEGSRITELADKAQMTKQSMSVLVYDMENAGYLQRLEDPADKRAYLFKMTPKGQEMFAVAGRIIQGILASWEVRMGAEKMEALLALLTELNGHIQSGK